MHRLKRCADGHGAVLRNCEIKDFPVIGLGSRVCYKRYRGSLGIRKKAESRRLRQMSLAVRFTSECQLEKFGTSRMKTRKYGLFTNKKYVELCSRYKKGLITTSWPLSARNNPWDNQKPISEDSDPKDNGKLGFF